jgi:general secretion pathway protein G
MSRNGKRRAAFTLIEVLLVIVILATLATIVVVTLWPKREEANIGMTKTKIEKVMGNLEEYANKFQKYPTEEQGGLKALITKPAYDKPELDALWREFCSSADDLKDTWGNDLRYKLEAVQSGNTTKEVPRVWSVGPNGQDENGEADDIKNHKWAQEAIQTQ